MKKNYKFFFIQTIFVVVFFVLATDWGRTLHLFFSLNYLLAIKDINNSGDRNKLITILTVVIFICIQINYWDPSGFNYFSLQKVNYSINSVINFKNNFLTFINEIIKYL